MIRIAGLTPESFSDGPGVRFVVFAQGCRHRCPGCHNPQTHPFGGGTLMEPDEILALMAKNPLLDGLTLSGGDPFEQAPAFASLAEKAKRAGWHVMTYTGYTWEELLQPGGERSARLRLLSATDLLVDGRFDLALKNDLLPFRGSSNQRMIDVPRSLREGMAVPAG